MTMEDVNRTVLMIYQGTIVSVMLGSNWMKMVSIALVSVYYKCICRVISANVTVQLRYQ